MIKARRFVAYLLSVLVVISAFFVGNILVQKDDYSFQNELTELYKKYDTKIDKALLEENEFALSRLIAVDYNGKNYGEIDSAVDDNGFAVLQFDSPNSAKNAYEEMKSDGIIVDPDGLVELDSFDTGEMYPTGSNAVGTKEYVNNFKMAKEDVLVAVIDTGVALDHPDLADRFYSRGFDFSSDGCADAEYDKNLETSVYLHSTFVCGIIANNTPDNVKIVPYKVFPFGNENCEISAILSSLNNAIELDVDVVNFSIRTVSSIDVFHSLVQKATDNGICICASAGNEGVQTYSYPSSFSETITVSALNRRCDNIASYSNYGKAIDFTAPGSHIISTSVNEDGYGYGEYSGTSFSTPYITACCADIKSMNRNLSKDDVYKILCDFSVDMGEEGKDIYFGNGIPNISKIVYTDNLSYEYRLPQGELDIYSAVNYTEKTQPWKLFRDKLVEVKIDDSLDEVGEYNFYGMSGAEFSFKTLNSVGAYSFNGCKRLTEISFDKDVEKIGRGAFKNIGDDFTISGYLNTPAENYAIEDGIKFVSIGCNHSYSIEIVDPEGGTEGYTIYTCVICGKVNYGEYIQPEIVQEGYCGENVRFELYNTGRLVLDGDGEMFSYENEKSPFFSFRNDVTSVMIKGAVSSVSPFALECCRFINSFKSSSDYIKVIDNSLYSADGKTLIYAYGKNYTMPETVECFNASAFVSSSVNINSNFLIENDLVYDKNGNILMALPSYETRIMVMEDDFVINDYAFIFTSYPISLRANSQNATVGKYAIGYSYSNGFQKDDFSYYGYDDTNAYQYAVENGFNAGSLNSGKCGDELYWRFDLESDELRLYGNGAMFDYSSKEAIPWYDYNSKIEHIVIENNVKSLSNYAFYDENNAIKSLTLPASLDVPTSKDVWQGCQNLEYIKITKGNGIIPDYGKNTRSLEYTYTPWYQSRDSLKEIKISNEIVQVGKYAFRNCYALKALELNNCLGISGYAFYNAKNLNKITLYNKSTLFDDFSFAKTGTNLKIYGYCDSTVKDFATDKNIDFVSLGCEHSRGYTSTGERAVCCYDSNVEYTCNDCEDVLYSEFIESEGNGHFVRATVQTNAEKPIQDAEIYLDGNLSAITNQYGNFVLDEVKCEIEHIIEVRKDDVLIASTAVETKSSNRTGKLTIHYGDFVCDNVINAKDYAFALRNGISDLDKLDYGKIESADSLDVLSRFISPSVPRVMSYFNDENEELDYKRDFIVDAYNGRDYIVKEYGFLYGKNMDDDFMTIENVGKVNSDGFALKISRMAVNTSTWRHGISYGSKTMDGKISARFYLIYSNGVKDYLFYSDVNSYEY